MKTQLVRASLFGAAALSIIGTAQAQGTYSAHTPVRTAYPIARSYVPPLAQPVAVINRELSQRLLALRQEAVAQQAADGGTLTAEHHAQLQQRLNNIHRAYRKKLSRSSGYHLAVGGV